MPDEEKKEESSAKWAREAFEFLKFFHREQKNLSGLIILQIGWALLLGIVAKIGLQDETPILAIPWPTEHWHIRAFPLTSVYPVGAAAIALYWLFSSGIQFYLYLFFFNLFRNPLMLLWYVFILPLVILSFPLWLVSWPLEAWLIRRWERDPKRDPQKLAEFKKDKDRATYLSLVRKQIHFRADWFFRWVEKWYPSIMVRLSSRATLGLAPLYSYSYEEDEHAAKVPMQILATAMGRLRIKLRHLEALRHIRFRVLPSFFAVPNPETAHILRRWLGLDALLWGSYLSANPPRIWLNLELPLPKTEDDSGLDKQEKPYRFGDLDPFSTQIDLDPSLDINQNHVWDVYIALLATIFLILQARRARKFTLYPKSLDRLYYSLSDEAAILDNLVKEALFSIQPGKETASQYTSALDALVTIAGGWIAQQLDRRVTASYADDFELLRVVAQRCIDIHPEDASGYYRLAAIFCVLENGRELHAALKTAIAKDKNLHWIGGITLSSWASVAIKTSEGDRVSVARALIYSSRAVACGGDQAREYLRKELEASELYKRRESDKEPDTLGVKLLYELLPSNPAGTTGYTQT